jgi:hypothetical protein
MTVATYAELKQAIQDWTKRDNLQSQLDTFIDMAESSIADVLRIREMETTATLTTSTTNRFIDLPADYIKLRRLQIYRDTTLLDMDMVPFKQLIIVDSVGMPSKFSVTDRLEFNIVSDEEYDLEMTYFRELTPLSAASPTNNILTNYPMIYLSGCLKHAFEHILLEDKAMYWQQQFDGHVARANRKARNGRYGPAPTMGISGMVI